MFYRDEQTSYVRRMARKRASSELFSEYRKIMEETTTILSPPLANTVSTASLKVNIYEKVSTPKGLIKRLSNNAEATEGQGVKGKPVKQRKG